MTYGALIRRIWVRNNVTADTVQALVEDVFRTIAKAAKEGPVRIPGFGTFEVRPSKGKRVVTPDGREFHSLPSRALKFSAAKQQKRTVKP